MPLPISQQRIMISKTNQIGDVSFALPIASALKKHDPTCTIIFMGRGGTRALIEQYAHVDEYLDWDTIGKLNEEEAIQTLRNACVDVILHIYPNKQIARLAKLAGIPYRVGTRRRFYHWLQCNSLPNIARKKSPLHETQLDMHYLKVFGIDHRYSLKEIIALRRFKPFSALSPLLSVLDPQRFNLILHPKTRGEHIEWPLEHFAKLIKLLPTDRFKILITGSKEEGQKIFESLIKPFPFVVDLTGKTTLEEMISLIANADGLIAASTGPVHLAANYEIHTLGLYAPIKPFDAGRWGPVGEKTQVLALNKSCSDCRLKGPCHCIASIKPEEVFKIVQEWEKIQSSELQE